MNLAQYSHLSPRDLAIVIRGEKKQLELEQLYEERSQSVPRTGKERRKAPQKTSNKTKQHSHPTREHKRFNQVWRNILDRCYNPNSANFKYYGAKGITVDQTWLDYANFFADMWPRPSAEFSIDRIDPQGNYSKTNCRWATAYEQIHNRGISK